MNEEKTQMRMILTNVGFIPFFFFCFWGQSDQKRNNQLSYLFIFCIKKFAFCLKMTADFSFLVTLTKKPKTNNGMNPTLEEVFQELRPMIVFLTKLGCEEIGSASPKSSQDIFATFCEQIETCTIQHIMFLGSFWAIWGL